MVKANKGSSNEAKKLRKRFPDLKIPTEIRESNTGAYVVVCIINKTNNNGVETATMRVITKDVNSWEAMSSHNNKAFNCKIVLLIHVPEEEGEEEEVDPEPKA